MRFIRLLILAALAICMLSAWTPSHARSLFWPQYRFRWDDHEFKHKHQHRHTKSDSTKRSQSQDAPRGPLQIIISIADQRISLYDNGALIARSSVSTGVEGHPTPLGVFSVLSKQKWHRSNIYSAAPMPYMQRLTWSGIALHAGNLPGYPASHGCIRVTNDFAIRLWHLTKRGTRVIIAHEDTRPVEITNAQLFVPTPKAAPALPESGAASLASSDSVTGATPHAPPISNSGEDAKTANSASPGGITQKVVPISVFVSRQSSKLFVRKGFTPLFDVPIRSGIQRSRWERTFSAQWNLRTRVQQFGGSSCRSLRSLLSIEGIHQGCAGNRPFRIKRTPSWSASKYRRMRLIEFLSY